MIINDSLNYTLFYLNDEISSLFFFIEILYKNNMVMGSYFYLISDISEAYGTWVLLLFLFSSLITITSSIQSCFEMGYSSNKLFVNKYNSKYNNYNQQRYNYNFFNFKFFKF